MVEQPRKTILVIDDEEAIVLLLETILEIYGYHCVSCLNPQNAIKTAEEIKPDLIILDIAMPEIDGYEICASLKKSENTSRIPIIMVTALALAQDRKKGLESGADSFIFKPFNPGTVISEIKKLLA
ncbi:MAG: response regulator [Erysipelotrichia bacterium]|nr:response regulator [Candidatus Riflebacteria bacterium]NCB38618.1 response regulator [Erysipelotrichia bacterium]